jgi:hypothetical protein
MFSIPPNDFGITTLNSLRCKHTDFIPDAHTLFIVVQTTVLGKPAK